MKRHLIVTTLDADYWPGLVALHNSFLRNSADGFDFAALVFGDEELAERVAARGIRVIANPPFPVPSLPLGKHHRDPARLPAMYGRLLVTELFPEYDRIVYLDADAVILKSLRPLAGAPMTQPIAATRCNGPMHYNVVGRVYPFEFGPMSSFYVIDRPLWYARGFEERWREVIQDPTLEFPFTVQGVLQATVERDWHCLRWEIQAHAGHPTLTNCRADVYVLHFMGTNPWDPLPQTSCLHFQEPARKLWGEYACTSS